MPSIFLKSIISASSFQGSFVLFDKVTNDKWDRGCHFSSIFLYQINLFNYNLIRQQTLLVDPIHAKTMENARKIYSNYSSSNVTALELFILVNCVKSELSKYLQSLSLLLTLKVMKSSYMLDQLGTLKYF